MVGKPDTELTVRRVGFGAMSITAMLELVTFLSRCYRETRNPTSKTLIRVGETISYMTHYVAQAITLEELVTISGMSRTNYIRKFEATMGASPINYLTGLRIEEACRLLRSTDRSISDIAFDVRFSDSNYFSRQFRKAGGHPRLLRPLLDQVMVSTGDRDDRLPTSGMETVAWTVFLNARLLGFRFGDQLLVVGDESFILGDALEGLVQSQIVIFALEGDHRLARRLV